jgi:hypothetical protein
VLADDVLEHGADGGVVELGERTAKLLLGSFLKVRSSCVAIPPSVAVT